MAVMGSKGSIIITAAAIIIKGIITAIIHSRITKAIIIITITIISDLLTNIPPYGIMDIPYGGIFIIETVMIWKNIL